VLEGLLVLVLAPILLYVTLPLVSMAAESPGLITQEKISTSTISVFRCTFKLLSDLTNVPIVGGRDRILERLLIEGTFDWEEVSVANVAEEYVMQHVSAMGLCLLIHIEDLERRVRDDHLCFMVLRY
jgi:hypothetical protein